MKIIMVSPSLYPYIGGVETHVWEISKRLVKKGYDVEIHSTDPSGELKASSEIDGVKIKRYRSFAPNSIYFFSRELYVSLKKARADIVHSHGYRDFPMLAAALAKTHNKIPFVVTLHLGFSKVGRLPYLIYNPLFGRAIFRRANRVIIVSPVEVKMIRALEKVKNKIILIPNGVDIKKISTYNSVIKFKATNRPVKIMYVGRLEEKKGVLFLIKAFKSVIMARNKDIELTIIGDGPLKQTLTNIIQELKLGDKVFLRGRLSKDDLYKLYAQSHVFVLPSEFEAHSLALTESMAFGLVPIATNVGGNKFLITDNTDGFLIKYPPKIDEISRTLLGLIDNPKLMSIMSKRAMKKARLFDIDKVVEKLEGVYQSIQRT